MRMLHLTTNQKTEIRGCWCPEGQLYSSWRLWPNSRGVGWTFRAQMTSRSSCTWTRTFPSSGSLSWNYLYSHNHTPSIQINVSLNLGASIYKLISCISVNCKWERARVTQDWVIAVWMRNCLAARRHTNTPGASSLTLARSKMHTGQQQPLNNMNFTRFQYSKSDIYNTTPCLKSVTPDI